MKFIIILVFSFLIMPGCVKIPDELQYKQTITALENRVVDLSITIADQKETIKHLQTVDAYRQQSVEILQRKIDPNWSKKKYWHTKKSN